MKKAVKNLSIIFLALLIFIPSNLFAAKDISIYLDGYKIETDVKPFISSSRTFVPIRFISEKIGCKVDWNQEKQMVTISKDNNNIKLTIGKKDVLINDKENVKNDVAPLIKNSRTFVPLRFITEYFDLETKWNSKEYRIDLVSKDENKNLSENEKVYVSSVKDLENKLKTSYDDLKSYFFENADKYSNEELKKIYDGKIQEINGIIEKIKALAPPEKFKSSHDFLVKSLDYLKGVLASLKDGFLNSNSDATKESLKNLTDFSIKINEHLKALQANIDGLEYIPDKAIELYNKVKENNPINDKTLNNLWNQIGK